MAYLRDKFKCVECGKITGLEAHHIIPVLETLDNLVTLCHSCHKKRHNYSGCFKKGFDSRRAIRPGNAGTKILYKLTRTKYYNRWTSKWENRK